MERKKYCAALFLDLLLWTGWFHYIIRPLKLTLKLFIFFLLTVRKYFLQPFKFFFDHNNLFFLLVHPVSSNFFFFFYNCAFHFVTGSRHHGHPSSLLLLSGHLRLRLPHWSFFRKKWIKKKYFNRLHLFLVAICRRMWHCWNWLCGEFISLLRFYLL